MTIKNRCENQDFLEDEMLGRMFSPNTKVFILKLHSSLQTISTRKNKGM